MGGHRILVADDSRTVALMVSHILTTAGWEVIPATDGVEAVQAAWAEGPELVLLDVHMPRLDGYQTCRLLKNDAVLAGLPVVLMTATEARRAEFWGRRAGMDALLDKGRLRPDALLGTLGALLATPRPPVPCRPAPSAESVLIEALALRERELSAATLDAWRLAAVVEHAATAALATDGFGRVAFASDLLCAWLGVAPDDLVGRPATQALGAANAALVELLAAAGVTRGLTLHHTDGGATAVTAAVHALPDPASPNNGALVLCAAS